MENGPVRSSVCAILCYAVSDWINRWFVDCFCRLSDFLFVAARYVAMREGKQETIYRRINTEVKESKLWRNNWHRTSFIHLSVSVVSAAMVYHVRWSNSIYSLLRPLWRLCGIRVLCFVHQQYIVTWLYIRDIFLCMFVSVEDSLWLEPGLQNYRPVSLNITN